MATTTLSFKVLRTEIQKVFALMEADNTPMCELRVKKPNGGVHEIEIVTRGKRRLFPQRTGGGGVTNG